jgi:hypothetical protein
VTPTQWAYTVPEAGSSCTRSDAHHAGTCVMLGSAPCGTFAHVAHPIPNLLCAACWCAACWWRWQATNRTATCILCLQLTKGPQQDACLTGVAHGYSSCFIRTPFRPGGPRESDTLDWPATQRCFSCVAASPRERWSRGTGRRPFDASAHSACSECFRVTGLPGEWDKYIWAATRGF